MNIKTVGSVCSGIEAASVAWEPLGMDFAWFSEIAEFPSRVLKTKYPNTLNLGDMTEIPSKIHNGEIEAPDLICGGTPCQAFSFAGWQNGLNDDRGNLTLKFVDIINANDAIRAAQGLPKTLVFWENVEGVLSDKTNAFGCLVSSLAGFSEPIQIAKWPNSGLIHGKKRNVAWRVIDAKYFRLPQQRKRLYLIAGDVDFYPENVLMEEHTHPFASYPKQDLHFEKEGHQFEVFREYTDCLYAAYGTKWNGNAAATNGSLFVVQDDRIRRLSPLETERLMGFPDNYTDLPFAKKTNRYQATGNSWAVPVVRWLGNRIMHYEDYDLHLDEHYLFTMRNIKTIDGTYMYCGLGKDVVTCIDGFALNGTAIPEECTFGNMKDIVSPNAPEDIYISPVGCYGIVRRRIERNMSINPRLEEVLLQISSKMKPEEIERRSRVQHRGRFSDNLIKSTAIFDKNDLVDSTSASEEIEENACLQISLFDLGGLARNE